MTIGTHLSIILITFGMLGSTSTYHIAVESQTAFNYNGNIVRTHIIRVMGGAHYFAQTFIQIHFSHCINFINYFACVGSFQSVNKNPIGHQVLFPSFTLL